MLSVVVPCFNEEEVVLHTHKRLMLALEVLDIDFEIIYVSDGSTDQTNQILNKLYTDSPNIVRVIELSRNFGHQIAVTAGIDCATGDAIVLIDADLQDPPELIPEMVQKWREGYEVVYCQRSRRQGESKFKLITAKLFYRLLAYLSDVDIPVDTGDFRLIDRKVVNVLKSMSEGDRFIRGMVSWVGYKQFALTYERAERFSGESKYPFWKMVRFATDGILSFSIKPLRLSMFIGFASSFFSALGILYAMVMWLVGTPVVGWTLMFIAITFFSGVQLVSLGVIGEYVGRSYIELKNRPLYVVRESKGVNE